MDFIKNHKIVEIISHNSLIKTSHIANQIIQEKEHKYLYKQNFLPSKKSCFVTFLNHIKKIKGKIAVITIPALFNTKKFKTFVLLSTYQVINQPNAKNIFAKSKFKTLEENLNVLKSIFEIIIIARIRSEIKKEIKEVS